MDSGTVLVTDGHLRAALAAARSLGRAGYRVVVCSPRRRSLAGSSRYADAHVQVPDPLARPHEFGDAIERLVASREIDVLLPMAEESLTVLLDRIGAMPGVVAPFPELSVFRRVSDKREVLEVAASLGIRIPDQSVLEDRSVPVPYDRLTFPLVLKPYRSVAGESGTRRKLGVSYARDPDELGRRVAGLPDEAFPLLLQRKIEGPGTGLFLLLWEGEALARFAHRRIREKPPSGGVSVLAESVRADPELLECSAALLRHFGWRGPAMVEFKEDARTGERYLMEINGRFWGSLQLATDAGVDFPRLAVEAALGRHPTPVLQYQPGVRWRWWWGDVDHLLARLKGQADPNHAGGVLRALVRLLFPGRHVRDDVLRWRDPAPFALETVEWLRGR